MFKSPGTNVGVSQKKKRDFAATVFLRAKFATKTARRLQIAVNFTASIYQSISA